MADNLGTLGKASVEIDVPLSGLNAGLAKARSEFQKGAQAVEKDAKTHFGSAGAAAERAMEGTRAATVKAAKVADENFRPAMAASAKALSVLGGIKAAGPIGELASSLTGAAMAAGPLGAALLALTAVAFAFTKSVEAASAGNRKLIDDLNAQRASMRERAKTFTDAAREIERAREAEARGSTVQIEALKREIEQTKALLTGAINIRDRLRREQGGTRDEWFDFDKSEAALKVAEGSVSEFYAAIEAQERALTTLVGDEARKRAEIAKKEADARAKAWNSGLVALMEQTEAARSAANLSGRDFGSVLDNRLAAIDAEERQAMMWQRWRIPGVSMTRDEEDTARKEMAARFEAQREQARNEARARFFASRTATYDRTALAFAEPKGPDDFAGQRKNLEVEREIAIREAKRKNEDVGAIESFFFQERSKIDDAEAAHRAKKAKEAGEERAEVEKRVADALLDAQLDAQETSGDALEAKVERERAALADLLAAARKHGIDTVALEEALGEKLQAIRDEAAKKEAEERDKVAADVQAAALELEASLTEVAAEGVETRVLALREGYAKLLADAERYGIDRTALEAAIEKKVAEIRKGAAYDAATKGDSFGEGFLAELGRMREEMQTLGGLGSSVARTLRDGFGSVFVGALQGADDLDERLSRLADRLSETMLGWAFEQLLFAGLGAVLPTTSPGYATIFGAPKAAAEGGEWEVGGGGSHDSQFVAFKATPGERFRAIPKHKSWADATGQGGGRTIVIVENHSGQKTEERRETGPGGEEIVRIVVGAVAKDIRRGGETAQAIEQSFGARRTGTRR